MLMSVSVGEVTYVIRIALDHVMENGRTNGRECDFRL
jgi:hypothetical protein